MLENPSSLTLRVNRTQIIMNYDTRPIDQTHQIFSSDHCQCCYSKYFRFDNQSNWTEICCITVTVNIMWSKVVLFSVYGSFWCSSSSGYSHIMLKSVNIPSCIISSVCVTAQIFSRLTVLDDVLHLLPDSEGQVAQVSWHMNQSSRRRLWIRLWDLDSGRTFRIRTAVDFTFRSRETRDTSRSLTFPSWLETPAEQTHHLSSRTQSIINQSINGWSENQTFRKQTSLAFIISSVSLIVCERAEMCLFISSSFSFIICFFCSSSSLSAVIVASSSSLRNCWSFSKLLFNLTLCVLSLRLKSNHIHFNHLPSTHINTSHHLDPRETQIPDYNRSRSRLLLVIYNIINWNPLY